MKKIIQNSISFLLILVMSFGVLINTSEANSSVALTIRSGNTIIYSGTVPLQTPGIIDLKDSSGNSHPLDANSVLSVIVDADISDNNWNISNLEYFDSFGSFYVKCLTSSVGENCENWQYVVDGSYPFSSMDKTILSGGENIYIYFGPQNKILLSANSIKETDNLIVTTQNYNYENNVWAKRNGVTVGITKPNPDDPFNPIEISTSSVDKDGKALFSNLAVDEYNVGVKEDFYFPTEPLSVLNASTPRKSGGGSSKSISGSTLGVETKLSFDLNQAYEFLISQQKEDGSFGEEIYTDWIAISLASSGHLNAVIKLIRYFSTHEILGKNLTDYERHAMALMALGLNPYNTNGVNYIEKIISSFDGKQFGDINEDNDDIFALIVLQNAGFTKEDEMIKSSIDFILSRQKENGSWDESVDMTGAAIEALTTIMAEESSLLLGVSQGDDPRGIAELASSDSDPRLKQLSFSILKAREFLKEKQSVNGDWVNVSATAWAMQGIIALGEKITDWNKNNLNPLDYFAINQDTDGGMKNENLQNKIWETAYVTTIYSEKTWNQIMQKFTKPENPSLILGDSTEIKVPTKIAPKKITIKETSTAIKSIEGITLNPEAREINPIVKPEPVKENWFARFIKFIF